MTLLLYEFYGLAPLNFDNFDFLSLSAVTRNPQHFRRQTDSNQEAYAIDYPYSNQLDWLNIYSRFLVHLRHTVSFFVWPLCYHEWVVRHNLHHVLLLNPLFIEFLCLVVWLFLLQSFQKSRILYLYVVVLPPPKCGIQTFICSVLVECASLRLIHNRLYLLQQNPVLSLYLSKSYFVLILFLAIIEVNIDTLLRFCNRLYVSYVLQMVLH